MATYWENSCSFGLRYVSWYKYLIVSLVFSHLGFWSGNLFLIAPFPDLCLLVPFDTPPHELLKSKLFNYGIGGKTIKWIDASFATDNKGLRLMALNLTGPLLYLVSLRAPFWAPCCSLCI